LAILLALQHRDEALLISTDRPYPRFGSEAHVGCVVPEALREKWRIIDRADRQALPRALKLMPEVDLCHYDSDKSYDGRMWASPRLWRALRPGGFFVSDDIEDNQAFRDFAAREGVEPLVVSWSGHFVGVLVKPPDNHRQTGPEPGPAR
ncbi:MAG: class I SAM-dependent methyltransferase, partial [bacterium]|nr:class I SAM-dependent methyltransferase [bacterium]